MSSALYQSIELLSREKGIEPGIVVGAVEEAIALATRKYYKTQENMRGELNKETGEITAYIYKTVVADEDEMEDPVNQITLEEAERTGARRRGRQRDPHVSKTPRRWAALPRSLAKQVIFQKVREAERDTVFQEYAHREKEVLNARSSASRARTSSSTGQGRSPLPQAGAVAARAVHHWRACPRGVAEGGSRRQGTAGDRLPRRAGTGFRTCSSPKFPRFTTTPCRFAQLPARPASAPRSLCRAATRTWIRSAPAWA